MHPNDEKLDDLPECEERSQSRQPSPLYKKMDALKPWVTSPAQEEARGAQVCRAHELT